MLVLDASVAVKMFQTEAGSEDARAIYVDHFGQLAAPEIFALEVAGVFVRIANTTKIARSAMEDALAGFRSMLQDAAIVLWPTSVPMLEAACQTALDLGHPLKDCIYLALADRSDWPLLTADVKFATKARAAGYRVDVLGEQN